MDWHRRFYKQACWTAGIRKYFFSRIETEGYQTCLEVGCGTGVVIQAVRNELQSRKQSADRPSQMFGLDIDFQQLRISQSIDPLALLTVGDALILPYRAGAFDIVFCHYFLLWVSDPGQALSEMQRVLRPGGWLAAFAEPDYGGRIDYPLELGSIGRLQETSLRMQGAETHMGRQLRALFNDFELDHVECGVLGSQWIEPADPLDMDDEWQVLKADIGELVKPEELERYHDIEIQSCRNSKRILYIPTFYAFGQKIK